ncbi:MAG TPA: hypothetical protein VGJ60_28015 [Chloroflexota bacterium]|jgi:hypothetical protein
MNDPQPHRNISVQWSRFGRVAVTLSLVISAFLMACRHEQLPERSLSDFVAQIRQGQVSALEVQNDRVLATTTSSERYVALLGHDDLFDVLNNFGVTPDDLA